ncbi:hypothetical protein V8E36_000339 [Tilletia maclaganii]
MNAYPAEFVQQHHPLMLVGGLLQPQQHPSAAAAAASESSASTSLPHATEAFPALSAQLVKILSSKGRSTTWDPNLHRSNITGGGGGGPNGGGHAGNPQGGLGRSAPTFRTILVPDNFRLPPRKVRLQPLPPPNATPAQSAGNGLADPAASLPAGVAPPPSGGAAIQMRSALSPLHPQSPLYPDGFISPVWVRKHRDVIPSLFVLFQVLPSGAVSDDPADSGGAETSESDAALIRYISNLRQVLTSRSIKLTVVLLTSRASLSQPTLEPRLSHLRRTSGLDSKGSLFVLTPVSEADLHDFIGSLQNALAEASTDYYREQARRVRRKRGKYPPPSSAYGSPLDTAPGTPPPVAPLTKEGWTLRSAYKLGTFAELSGDLSLSLEHYVNAYDVLCSTAPPHNGGLLGDTRVLPPRTKRWAEAKALADTLVIRIARGWLLLGLEAHTFTIPIPAGEGRADAPPTPEKTRPIQVHLPSREAWERALGVFRAHLRRFEELSNGWGMGESTGEWWSWVGKQYRMFADLVDALVRSYRQVGGGGGGAAAAAISLATILPEHCPPLPANLLHPGALGAYSAALSAATSGVGRSGVGAAERNSIVGPAAGGAGPAPYPHGVRSSHERMSSVLSTSTARSSTMPGPTPPDHSAPAPPLSLATSLALTLTGPALLAPSPLASKSGVAPATGVLPHPGQWYLLAALCAEERWKRWRVRAEREEAEREAGRGREVDDDPSTAVERRADHGNLVIEALSKAYECFKRPAGSMPAASRSRTASYVAARMAHAYLLSNQPGLALAFAQRVLVPFRGSVHVNPAGSRPAPGRSEGVLLDLLLVGADAAAQLEEQQQRASGPDGSAESESQTTKEVEGEANGAPIAGGGEAGAAPAEMKGASAGQYRATRLRFLWEALNILVSGSKPHSALYAGMAASVQDAFADLLYSSSPRLSGVEADAEAITLEAGVAAHGSLFRADVVFWEESVEVGQETRFQLRLVALGPGREWTFERVEVDVGPLASRSTFVVQRDEHSEGGVVELGPDVVKADLRIRSGGESRPLVFERVQRATHAGSLRVAGVRLYPTVGAASPIISLTPFNPDLVYAGLPARQAQWLLPDPHNRYLRLSHRIGLTECIVKARTYAVKLSAGEGETAGRARTVYLNESVDITIEVRNEETSEAVEGKLDVVCTAAMAEVEHGAHPDDVVSFECQGTSRELLGVSLGVIKPGESVQRTITLQALGQVGVRQLQIRARVQPPTDVDDSSIEADRDARWAHAYETSHNVSVSVVHPFHSRFSLAWSQHAPVRSRSQDDRAFVSVEDEVFVHPDGTPNGALAQLSAEFEMKGPVDVDVQSAVVVFGSSPHELSTVRTYDTRGTVETAHADRLQRDWSADLEGDWMEGDCRAAHVQIEVARESGIEYHSDPSAGHVELQWRRKGAAEGRLTRTVLPLPPITAPPGPTVSITLLPASFARLGEPFVLKALVKNEQSFRTADVRLEVESSDSFVFAGARKLMIPALLPRSERKVVWRLVGRQTGWVALPTIRAEDWRAKNGDLSSSMGDESSETIPQSTGGAVPVYDGRRLGSSSVIPISGAGPTADAMQDELRQAMGVSSPPRPLSKSSTGGAHMPTTSVSLHQHHFQSNEGPPLPPSMVLAGQQQQRQSLQRLPPSEAYALGPVRAPERCFILVVP